MLLRGSGLTVLASAVAVLTVMGAGCRSARAPTRSTMVATAQRAYVHCVMGCSRDKSRRPSCTQHCLQTLVAAWRGFARARRAALGRRMPAKGALVARQRAVPQVAPPAPPPPLPSIAAPAAPTLDGLPVAVASRAPTSRAPALVVFDAAPAAPAMQALAQRISVGTVFRLADRVRLRALVSSKGGCLDLPCRLRVTKALGARYGLSPEVLRVGKHCYLAVTMFDAQRVRDVTTWHSDRRACTARELGASLATSSFAAALAGRALNVPLGRQPTAPRCARRMHLDRATERVASCVTAFGAKHGPAVHWHRNKTLSATLSYQHGRLHGVVARYGDRGEKLSEAFYVGGVPLWLHTYQQGALLASTFYEGPQVASHSRYAADGSLADLAIYDGGKVSERTRYQQGRTSSVSRYRSGKHHGWQPSYDTHGQLRHAQLYADGRLMRRIVVREGVITSDWRYRRSADGRCDASAMAYYEDGPARRLVTYVGSGARCPSPPGGMPDGPSTSWYVDGRMRAHGRYLQGKREGVWVVSTSLGAPLTRVVYRAGQRSPARMLDQRQYERYRRDQQRYRRQRGSR